MGTRTEEFKYIRYGKKSKDEVERKFLVQTYQDLNIVCLRTLRLAGIVAEGGGRFVPWKIFRTITDKSPLAESAIDSSRPHRYHRVKRAKLTGKKKTSGRDRIYDAARRSQFVRFAVTREINR